MSLSSGKLYLVGFNSGENKHLGLGAVDPVPLEVCVLAATARRAEWRNRDIWMRRAFTLPGCYSMR